jgi:branched-chain amino acid aminotransferase
MASDSPILYNGKIISSDKVHIALDSTWARFAPGFFETMKFAHGTLFFWEDHYDRMKLGAKFWDVKIPTKPKLLKSIFDLIEASGLGAARIRLQFIIGNKENDIDFLATISPLEYEHYTWNDRGYGLTYFDKHLIAAQQAPAFKSNSRDLYLLAERTVQKKLDTDVVLMNTQKEVVDTPRFSIFWIKNGVIYSPPVSAGGVDSTFSKFLFGQKREWDLKLFHKPTKLKDLESADEIFLANVIRGIQWVKSFRKSKYTHEMTLDLFERVQDWEANL